MADRLRAIPSEPTPEPSGEPSLADLIAASARGDEAAFAALYDATSSRLHGMVLRVIRNPAHADEVTQECFLEIWRQTARYSPDLGSPMAWMLTIAHRRAVDRVRSAEASSQRDVAYGVRNVDTAHDSTAEQVTASLEAKRVREALATLTEAQRSAIELAYFGGYTHTEVAQLLGLPLGTAKTRIRDGLIRLRDALGVES